MNKERPQTRVVLLPSQRMHNQELRASDMQGTQHPHTFESLSTLDIREIRSTSINKKSWHECIASYCCSKQKVVKRDLQPNQTNKCPIHQQCPLLQRMASTASLEKLHGCIHGLLSQLLSWPWSWRCGWEKKTRLPQWFSTCQKQMEASKRLKLDTTHLKDYNKLYR